MDTTQAKKVAETLRDEVFSLQRPKRMKVRTLLGHFGYEKRTEENAVLITELLSEYDVLLNPSIMKLGEVWQLKLDERISLSPRTQDSRNEEPQSLILPLEWNTDGWFDTLTQRHFRTEKEVETKFIIPLLTRLGYNEDDRYDGMTFAASHGSKHTTLEADFALFNSTDENLENQVLLVVEAKKETRLVKEVELDKAQRQVKSYAIWLSCHFGLITDSNKIQVIDLFPSIGGLKILFECTRDELKEKFGTLYSLISKKSLTAYYENLLR
jgi:hypothetical protein